MADYRAPLDDIRFILKDVFAVDRLWESLAGIQDADMETADAILESAAKICQDVLGPINREADEVGCRWNNGEVTTPEGFKEAYQTFGEGGWVGLGGNPEFGGMGMPKTLVSAVEEMVQGSCMSFGLAPMLTAGACLALDAHASEVIKNTYLPKMYSGQWSGSMDLTEAHAGTDLGLIRTKAVPEADGSYCISGTKIFITWGEHDMVENVVHLVLAKLPDAPSGSRGISLFVVPKFLPSDDGSVGERNSFSCGSIEKKMGIKASATCVMNFDGAKGWLVGEPNKGLACMFTMMNYERLVVGIQGLGTADYSYQNALAYAQERIQSRSPAGVVAPEQEADPLIVHPDIRRMLLTMKAFNEGGRAFYTYVAQWLDIAKYCDEPERRKHGENMVSLLTPVAKAFMTDVALETAIQGQQIFGGHGYIREWGQEQFVRDIRITQIYEGTNGIQAMDLIGRKTVAAEGQLTRLFIDDVEEFIASHPNVDEDLVQALQGELDNLTRLTENLVLGTKGDPNLPGAVAVDYLHLFGYVAYAYMWLRMASAVDVSEDVSDDFKIAKRKVARFYFKRLLPQTRALTVKIAAGSDATMALTESQF